MEQRMTNLITEARELCEKWSLSDYAVFECEDCIANTVIYKVAELCDALEQAEAEIEKMKPFYKIADDTFRHWENAAYAMRDDERKRHRWIPVTERLPETSGAYWVNLHQEDEDGNDADFCIEAWYQVNQLLFAPKEVGWQLLNEWYEFSGQMRQYISHWMPLPAPPEEGE